MTSILWLNSSFSCLNISYGEVQGLVANPHPTGSPYAPVIPNGNSIESGSGAKVSTSKKFSPFVISLGDGRNLDLSINTVPGNSIQTEFNSKRNQFWIWNI